MVNKLSSRVLKREVLPSASFHGKILEMQKKGRHIIDLTIGITNLLPPDYGRKAAINAIKKNTIYYTAVGGSEELKNAIAKKLLRQNAIIASPSQILITQGAKQAIFQALYTLTDPQDEVAIFIPYWPAYTNILSSLRLKPVFITFSDIPRLEKVLQSKKIKAIIFDNPHVPSGKVFSKDELMAISDFAKKRDIILITDESYENLVYEEKKYSIHEIMPQIRKNLVTIFSISQSYSMMGWRMGYVVADADLVVAMEALQSSITASISGLTQEAVTSILNNDKTYESTLQKTLKKRRDYIFPKLASIPWINCEKPNAGPYFWCNIEKLTKDSQAFSKMLFNDFDTAVLPGENFGTPGWIRIAFSTQTIKEFEEAIKRINLCAAKFTNNSHS